MALTAHFILTYTCLLRCSHCDVNSTPRARGRFTQQALNHSLTQIAQTDRIDSVVFTGGEPFLVYPTLLYGVNKARQIGLRVTIMTNGFFARSHATGIRILRSLAESGLDEIQVSIDGFHYSNRRAPEGARTLEIAAELGIKVRQVCISRKDEGHVGVSEDSVGEYERSEFPLRFFGRAVELISENQPRFPSNTFTQCPDRELVTPGDIYLDPEGLVSVCPGVVIENFYRSSIKEILENHPARENSILQCLIQGGPAELFNCFPLPQGDQFADACHACFTARKALLDPYPDFLAPKQVYGSL